MVFGEVIWGQITRSHEQDAKKFGLHPKDYKPPQTLKSEEWHVLIPQCEEEVEKESRMGEIKLQG